MKWREQSVSVIDISNCLTYLHGLLSVCLLQLYILNIRGHTELRTMENIEVLMLRSTLPTRQAAYQVIVFSLHRSHDSKLSVVSVSVTTAPES
jgi:hypothetical protein